MSNQRTLLLLAFVPPLTATLWIISGVPPYIELYASFGFQLPLATAVLFRWYALIAFIPWLFVAGWVLVPRARNKGAIALGLSLFLSVLIFAFAIWATHLPMQDLASRL